jgi:amidase
MLIIPRSKVFYGFSPDNLPAARVQQGEEFTLETQDCFGGQIRQDSFITDSLDWENLNPATGPVYIEGIQPGDVVRFDILQVQVASQAVVIAIPDSGLLGDVITRQEAALMPMAGDELVFRSQVRIPIHPMIGVIGVAPETGSVPNILPGDHGGNMDCKTIAPGARLYFTAGAPGALFGCGDLHSAMGDGEVVDGAETAGRVTVKAQAASIPGLPTPFLETAGHVAVLATAPTLDEASAIALHRMARFLVDRVHIPLNDAGMLMGLVGELKICQVGDSPRTVRFEFPKYVLQSYHFSL